MMSINNCMSNMLRRCLFVLGYSFLLAGFDSHCFSKPKPQTIEACTLQLIFSSDNQNGVCLVNSLYSNLSDERLPEPP